MGTNSYIFYVMIIWTVGVGMGFGELDF